MYVSLSQRELRTTSTGDGSLAEKRASAQRAQKVSYLVWIGVSKEGLQTNVELEGEWLFANHLPQEVQVGSSRIKYPRAEDVLI